MRIALPKRNTGSTMNWLEFTEKMFGHLAWPLVVLIVLFSVRKHVSPLAERILELSFGGATVKFDKLLTEGADLIEEVPATTLPKDAEAQPQGMYDIPSAYAVIERDLGEIASLLGLKTREPRAVMRSLWKRGLISEELVKLHETLRQGKNATAHGAFYAPTRSEEKEYARQALVLALNLHQVGTKLAKTAPSK